MKNQDARRISERTLFTKVEMLETLDKALNSGEIDWKKASPSNGSFSLGHYFNDCVRWVNGSSRGQTEFKVSEIVAFRVLHGFGKYHKDYPFGLEDKKPLKKEVPFHAEPTMNPKPYPKVNSLQ